MERIASPTGRLLAATLCGNNPMTGDLIEAKLSAQRCGRAKTVAGQGGMFCGPLGAQGPLLITKPHIVYKSVISAALCVDRHQDQNGIDLSHFEVAVLRPRGTKGQAPAWTLDVRLWNQTSELRRVI